MLNTVSELSSIITTCNKNVRHKRGLKLLEIMFDTTSISNFPRWVRFVKVSRPAWGPKSAKMAIFRCRLKLLFGGPKRNTYKHRPPPLPPSPSVVVVVCLGWFRYVVVCLCVCLSCVLVRVLCLCLSSCSIYWLTLWYDVVMCLYCLLNNIYYVY